MRRRTSRAKSRTQRSAPPPQPCRTCSSTGRASRPGRSGVAPHGSAAAMRSRSVASGEGGGGSRGSMSRGARRDGATQPHIEMIEQRRSGNRARRARRQSRRRRMAELRESLAVPGADAPARRSDASTRRRSPIGEAQRVDRARPSARSRCAAAGSVGMRCRAPRRRARGRTRSRAAAVRTRAAASAASARTRISVSRGNARAATAATSSGSSLAGARRVRVVPACGRRPHAASGVAPSTTRGLPARRRRAEEADAERLLADAAHG